MSDVAYHAYQAMFALAVAFGAGVIVYSIV